MHKEIKFYRRRDGYFEFTNFYGRANHGTPLFTVNGIEYVTSEHYYQSKKFEGTEFEEITRLQKRPGDAARYGRQINLPLRQDWDEVKDRVMWFALYYKFSQNDDLKNMLIGTDGAVLIENSPKDYYWGIGASGRGKNRLGILLMGMREYLKGLETDKHGDLEKWIKMTV